jgi:hypothetical protein
MQAIMRLFTLERLLVIGLLLAGFGLWGIIRSLLYWQDHHYGELDYETMMRMIMPAAVALVIGIQTVFGSFLADIIGLATRRK